MKPPLLRLADIPRLDFFLGMKRIPQPKGRTVRPDPSGLNQSELRYMKHLAGRVARKEIAGYWPHALKFRLADKTWYTPDALVMENDGLLSLHELKGWMEDDAAVKLKVTSETYWLFPVKLVREKPRGCFLITEIGR
jgi:hypothetical protein